MKKHLGPATLALAALIGCSSTSAHDGGTATDSGVDAGPGDGGTGSLFVQYGGASTVSMLVSDAVIALLADCVTAPYFTNTIGKPGHDSEARLESCLRLQLTAVLGGPATYPGTDDNGDMCEPMATIHSGLGISNDVFNAFITDFSIVLETDGVSATDTQMIAMGLMGLQTQVISPSPINYDGCDGGIEDGGVEDGGVDGGDLDAGVDAGTHADAGTDGGVDAGPADAGSDGGVDAGPADAGSDGGVDAGPADAGVDAGVIDAGVIDAGVIDAGETELDAGLDAGETELDAGLDAGGDAGDIETDAGLDAGVDGGTP